MKDKLKYYIKEIIVFTAALTIIANAVSYYRSGDINKESLEFNSVILLNGVEYSIPKNKPVVIHFWATWCPTCKVEAANIQRLSKDYEVLTIAVNSKDDKYIKEYLKKQDLNFKTLNDKNGYYASKFNIEVFPTTLIYNKNKELVFSEVGFTSTLGLYLRMFFVNYL